MKTTVISLALLLLTGACSIGDAKRMDVVIPQDAGDTSSTTKINHKVAVTVLLEGNKEGKIYYYEGKLDSNTIILQTTQDSGFRAYAQKRNSAVINEMNLLRAGSKNAPANDTAFKRRANEVHARHKGEAPFFIVKWGGDAAYAEVIEVIDLLKVNDVEDYALTPVTGAELEMLEKITGRHYPELDEQETEK